MLKQGTVGAYAALGQRRLYWQQGEYRALRQGKWELQVQEDPAGEWLFDLEQDPTEQVNLATRFPDKTAELRQALEDLAGEMAEPMWRSPYRMRMRVGPHVDEGDQAQTDFVWNGRRGPLPYSGYAEY